MASLAHIGRTITERKWKKVKYWFTAENNRSSQLQSVWYYSVLESKRLHMVAMEREPQVSRWYFQLKSGHAVMDTYLKPIGKTDTDQWWECTLRARMDTHYVMLSSTVSTKETREMGRKCEEEGEERLGQSGSP